MITTPRPMTQMEREGLEMIRTEVRRSLQRMKDRQHDREAVLAEAREIKRLARAIEEGMSS